MSTTPSPPFKFFDSAMMPWQPSRHADGVYIKKLGKADGSAMELVRFDSGAHFPIHQHLGPEFVYILEGEAIQNGHRLTTGCAAVAEKGTVDAKFHSPSGCVFLLVHTLTDT